MDLQLRGKKALVTGGSHGIGQSIVFALADEGCDVAFCSRTNERLDETQKALEKKTGINHLSIITDVLKPVEVERCFDLVEELWGGVDILINNVGGGGRWGNKDIVSTDRTVWAEVYQKNAGATTNFTLRAIPMMKKKRWGRVITITSIYGVIGGGRPWFNMAKAAQTTFMKNMALNREFVRSGITFNSVAPGGIMIPETGWDDQQISDPSGFKTLIDKNFPLGRMGTPEEVADLVTFLASPRAGLINGASLVIDGSETSKF